MGVEKENYFETVSSIKTRLKADLERLLWMKQLEQPYSRSHVKKTSVTETAKVSKISIEDERELMRLSDAYTRLWWWNCKNDDTMKRRYFNHHYNPHGQDSENVIFLDSTYTLESEKTHFEKRVTKSVTTNLFWLHSLLDSKEKRMPVLYPKLKEGHLISFSWRRKFSNEVT